MGVLTDFYAFDTAEFESLRKARRIRALANALVTEKTPPIAIQEERGIDKAHFDHFALLLEASMSAELAAERLSPRFFLGCWQSGLRNIAHPHADIGYWDPFSAVQIFDAFDLLADRHVRDAKVAPIVRAGGARIKQPGDSFHWDVEAYSESDLAAVFRIVRAVMERIELPERSIRPATTPVVIDAFFEMIAFLHRAFEPLTPNGRRGSPWTIVATTR